MGSTNSSSPFRIGHVLINVKNLKQAKMDFERMGFNVAWGGAPNKAINAMVFLPEGGFIELFSMEIGAVPRAVMGGLLKVMKVMSHPSESRYRHYLLDQKDFQTMLWIVMMNRIFKKIWII